MEIWSVASSVCAVLILRCITYFEDRKCFGWQKILFHPWGMELMWERIKSFFQNCCLSANECFWSQTTGWATDRLGAVNIQQSISVFRPSLIKQLITGYLCMLGKNWLQLKFVKKADSCSGDLSSEQRDWAVISPRAQHGISGCPV